MKNSVFGILINNQNEDVIYKYYKELFANITKNFKQFYIIDISELVFFQKKKEKKFDLHLFPKNFQYKKVFSKNDLDNFLENKNLVAINNIDKNPSFYWVLYLLKLHNVKLINIFYGGEIGLTTSIDFSLKGFYKFNYFYNKGFYPLFRILTLLRILPRIEILFHSNINILENMKNGYLRKIENILPFLKLSYYARLYKVNARAINFRKTNANTKYILFVDCPIMSGDRILLERINLEDNHKFYKKVTILLKLISKIFNKKIIISPHPKYKNSYLKNSLFKIETKKTTREMISESYIVIFSTSGAIVDAIIQKKLIINFYSKLQGNFQNKMNEKYIKELNLFTINLDDIPILDKKLMIKLMIKSRNSYTKYIKKRLKTDGSKNPNLKIVKIIKNNFF